MIICQIWVLIHQSVLPTLRTNQHVALLCMHASLFCSDDEYCVSPGRTWTASGRGVCLVKKVTASVQTEGSDTEAVAYGSSGTSFSQFAIISKGNGYAVTRIVN